MLFLKYVLNLNCDFYFTILFIFEIIGRLDKKPQHPSVIHMFSLEDRGSSSNKTSSEADSLLPLMTLTEAITEENVIEHSESEDEPNKKE